MEKLDLHPSADLAILKLASKGRESIEPFTATGKALGIGGDYSAYGFAEDSIGPNEGTPTARLFKGHSQRVFHHESHMRYRYAAIELSFPCPGGLSGGPIFKHETPESVFALATENIEASTILSGEEVLLRDGNQFTESQRRIIEYGVGLLLNECQDFIDAIVPKTLAI